MLESASNPAFLPNALEKFHTNNPNLNKDHEHADSVLKGLKKTITIIKISGSFIHPNGDPLADQKISLFTPGWLKDSLIKGSETVTDKNGNFKVEYKLKHRHYEKTENLLIKVFEKTISSEVGLIEREVKSIPVTIPIHQSPYHFEKPFQVKLYEAQSNFPMMEIDDFFHRPQQTTGKFYLEVITKAIKDTIKSLVALALRKISPEQVQNIINSSGSVVALTPENTVDFMLNGLWQARFRQGKNSNELITVMDFDDCDKKKSPDLVNTRITLAKNDDKLNISEIKIQFPDKRSQTFTPGTPGFIDAINKVNSKNSSLYLSNSMGFIRGEVEHLTHHLITGQLALSFFRHINNHPIKRLLEPHLEGVSEINRLGAGLIFGDHGILTLSALTGKGVDQLLENGLGSFDFATFRPRQPLVPEHRCAKAQQLFWKIVTEVVDQFFNEQGDAMTSPDTWHEVYYMSQNLMKQSLPYRPYEGGKADWIDRSDIDQPEVPGRVVYNGHLRAIRPFIGSIDKPDGVSVEKLKQFCRFVLYDSTFYHWVLHMSQKKWGTNPDMASLAPEGGNEAGWGGTNPFKAALQVDASLILTDFDAPKIVENRFKNIYQPFIDKLLAYKVEFAELGYDISDMHSGIWI